MDSSDAGTINSIANGFKLVLSGWLLPDTPKLRAIDPHPCLKDGLERQGLHGAALGRVRRLSPPLHLAHSV